MKTFFFLLVLCSNSFGQFLATSFRYPIDDTWNVSRGFGEHAPSGTNTDRYHAGDDIGRGEGLSEWRLRPSIPVYAIADGVVKFSGILSGYGGVAVIEHTLASGEQICSVYGHLNMSSLTGKGVIRKGEKISVLANAGETWKGQAVAIGTGRHLHFGIRKEGYSTSPDSDGQWRFRGYCPSDTLSQWYPPSQFLAQQQNSFRFRQGSRACLVGNQTTFASPYGSRATSRTDGQIGTVTGGPTYAFDDGKPSGATHANGTQASLFWRVLWDSGLQQEWVKDNQIKRCEAVSLEALVLPSSAVYPSRRVNFDYVVSTTTGSGNHLLSLQIQGSDGQKFSTAPDDTIVFLNSSRSYVLQRPTTIPATLRPGLYGVVATIYKDNNSNGIVDTGDYNVSELILLNFLTIRGPSNSGGVGGGGEGYPELSVVDIEISDDASGRSEGDGDGIIEPGEKIEISLTVKNSGEATALGVKAYLNLTQHEVSVQDDDFTIGDIRPGKKETDGSFCVSLPPTFDDDQLELSIEFRGENGEWFATEYLQIEVPEPRSGRILGVSLPFTRTPPGGPLYVQTQVSAESTEDLHVHVEISDSTILERYASILAQNSNRVTLQGESSALASNSRIYTSSSLNTTVGNLTAYLYVDTDQSGGFTSRDTVLDIHEIKNVILIDACMLNQLSPVQDATVRFPYNFLWTAPDECGPVHFAISANPTDGPVATSGNTTKGRHLLSPEGWQQIRGILGDHNIYYWTLREKNDDDTPGRILAPWRPIKVSSTPAPNYVGWLEFHFRSSENLRLTEDTDGDGSDSLLEYAIGQNPVKPSYSNLPIYRNYRLGGNETFPGIQYVQITGVSDVYYEIGIAFSLNGPWDWSGYGLRMVAPPERVGTRGDLEIIRLRFVNPIATEQRVFFRLRAKYLGRN